MNDVQKKFFAALNQDRTENANMLEKPSMRGIQRSVVEKYTDQAHFIYELLQNADDVGATSADFILYKDRLVFKHNGTRHFFVTDPAHETEDSEKGTLGDLNAITSVANSNKQKASIGKFGVGFKAVFQYTNTPHIYDPNIRFKIERFIVPIELEDDYPNRKKGETVFVFPFDHKEREAAEAYEDIDDKLRNLVYPILFLQNLESISFEIGETIGLYGKSVHYEWKGDGFSARKLCLQKNAGDDIVEELLWMFSREDENGRNYSVVFFSDTNDKLLPANLPAFCFFPTKEVTNLNFVIHAPFLLTDSREGIKAGEAYNRELIKILASLAAESLNFFYSYGRENGKRIIDDSILDIVPINKFDFSDLNDKDKISFLPFYTALKTALAEGLLPTETGYTKTENAYWSDTIEINRLFNDNQLSQLLDEADLHWVFKTYGRNTASHNAREGIQEYIDEITSDWINETDISNNISSDFISAQSEEWLHSFYAWLGDTSRRFIGFKARPVFLDSDGYPAAAYDRKGEQILFLPSTANIDCPTINNSLLENESTRDFLINVVKLEEPSLKDYVYNTIVPQYNSDGDIDTDSHFSLFFSYYCECRHDDASNFISTIRDLAFLTYYEKEFGQAYRECAQELYYPDEFHVQYFSANKDANFIALSDYLEKIGEDVEKQNLLQNFLNDLGIRRKIQIIQRQLLPSEVRALPYQWHSSNGENTWIEYAPDGCAELLADIVNNPDASRSLLLWNGLIEVASTTSNISSAFRGFHKYFYYYSKTEDYETALVESLKQERWIVCKDGRFAAPSEINIQDMADFYDIDSDDAFQLIHFLGVGIDSHQVNDDEDNLTEEQRKDIALAQKIKKAGLDDEKILEEFIEFRRRKEEIRRQMVNSQDKEDFGVTDSGITEVVEDIKTITRKRSLEYKKNDPTTDGLQDGNYERIYEEKNEEDVDEYHPQLIDYEKQIERKKEASSGEIESILQMQELQKIAVSSERYTFGWLNTLLDMEILNSGENNSNSREVNISFGKIGRSEGTLRTLVLQQPNKYIPQYMEELADIPLLLRMDDDSVKKVAIEVTSVKSYTLRVKLREKAEISDAELAHVREATIKATKPVFLLEKLREGILSLGFSKMFNLKENLPSNIEFIFGPPGTGKTTYLVNDVILPLVRENAETRILVLAPTNKSADVITERIIDFAQKEDSYLDWLVRFGITDSERIEKKGVYRDKTFDIRQLQKNVTVTTIARYPYDYFMPGTDRLFLDQMEWDYIIIDEASMIPLVNIIYLIYNGQPQKFIVAGDPFQIEPVTSVELWENENIYTLVNLNSFVNPVTQPIQYKVTTLTTQYRSIPAIGSIVSRFTYGGILQHSRSMTEIRDLHINHVLDVKPLNIIKFPVSKYESIYKSKRLKGTTPYQVYSAVFTMEFTLFLCELISKNNSGEHFSIGIVVPYKAQANLISRLILSAEIPSNISVLADTIHGFQGDECDIVLVVLNPPPGISDSDKLFLNRQNILNVAISRARDYLFVLMPDENTENVSNLKKIKQIETMIRDSTGFAEYDAHYLENLIFGSPNYIEENSFATSHQSVNVYGQPEMKYEIRSEDAAVDIQLHKTYTLIKKDSVPSNEISSYIWDDEEKLTLDINCIPPDLREDALEVDVSGAINGVAYLVPYEGKLSNYISKPLENMFLPIVTGGQKKMLNVSVVIKDRIIYIPSFVYAKHEERFFDPVELLRSML